MSALLLAFSPFVTSLITGWVKGWTPFANLSDGARTAGVRVLAALVALAYTVVGFWVTGNFDGNALNVAVNAFVPALVAWLGSLGIFHAFFQPAPAK